MFAQPPKGFGREGCEKDLSIKTDFLSPFNVIISMTCQMAPATFGSNNLAVRRVQD